MKYVAILESDTELSEEILEDIKSATFVGGSPTPYSCILRILFIEKWRVNERRRIKTSLD